MTGDRGLMTGDTPETAEWSSDHFSQSITEGAVTFLASTDFVKLTHVFDTDGYIIHGLKYYLRFHD
jgi:hypothetical protein